MKAVLFLIYGIGLYFASLAQPDLSKEAWRSDLHWLQQTIHKNYSNLFYNVSAKQFDSAVAAIDDKIGTMTDMQTRVEFMKLISMFRIGHTAILKMWYDDDKYPSWIHPLPVKFYLFDDGLYIMSIKSDYKEAVGGKVLQIGNKNAKEAMELIRPVIPYENEQGYKNSLQYYLNCTEILHTLGIINDPGKATVKYLKNGKEQTITIKAGETLPRHHSPIYPHDSWVNVYTSFNTPNSALWLKKPARLRYFEYLPHSKTVYVRHSAVVDEHDETIKQFFDKVFEFVDKNDVDKFVLDLRLNGGGNNYLNKPVITGIIQSRKINRKGHLFIILGKATFSAAQNLSNELEKYTECIFVGEPTSENVNFWGDIRMEVLPNSKLIAELSWLWWQNLDPRDKRQWTAPHLATGMTFSEYASGIDPAMDAILNYKQVPPIEDQVKSFLEKGKFEEALTTAQNYLSNPMYRFSGYTLEDNLNSYGYELLGKNMVKESQKVFFINVQLFPASANACDSYAEICWKAGDKKEAVKYYELSISKDPNGPAGENSRRMLERLRKEL